MADAYCSLHGTVVGALGAIRDGYRIWIAVACQYARIEDDDDVYETRSRAELSEGNLVRENQQSNRAQGPEPGNQPSEGQQARPNLTLIFR